MEHVCMSVQELLKDLNDVVVRRRLLDYSTCASDNVLCHISSDQYRKEHSGSCNCSHRTTRPAPMACCRYGVNSHCITCQSSLSVPYISHALQWCLYSFGLFKAVANSDEAHHAPSSQLNHSRQATTSHLLLMCLMISHSHSQRRVEASSENAR